MPQKKEKEGRKGRTMLTLKKLGENNMIGRGPGIFHLQFFHVRTRQGVEIFRCF